MLVGGIIGFLLGLLYCYWHQIQVLSQNANLISSGSTLVDAAGNFYDQLKQKL